MQRPFQRGYVDHRKKAYIRLRWNKICFGVKLYFQMLYLKPNSEKPEKNHEQKQAKIPIRRYPIKENVLKNAQEIMKYEPKPLRLCVLYKSWERLFLLQAF